MQASLGLGHATLIPRPERPVQQHLPQKGNPESPDSVLMAADSIDKKHHSQQSLDPHTGPHTHARQQAQSRSDSCCSSAYANEPHAPARPLLADRPADSHTDGLPSDQTYNGMVCSHDEYVCIIGLQELLLLCNEQLLASMRLMTISL